MNAILFRGYLCQTSVVHSWAVLLANLIVLYFHHVLPVNWIKDIFAVSADTDF
jgi:hypothetical protein